MKLICIFPQSNKRRSRISPIDLTIDLKHYLALVILKSLSLSVFLTIFKLSAAVE